MVRNNRHIKVSAFSLIEVSIVILIVGVLIAGLIQGNSLIKKTQLITAQNLTKNSPVNNIKNLISWYETSLESSFRTDEAINGNTVSIWHDINTQSVTKNHITQSTDANKPKFYENVFGGIPSVRFDGVNDTVNGDYLSFDSTDLMSTNFTIFVVEKRGGDKSNYDMFLAGTGNSATLGVNLVLGYRAGDDIAFVLSGNLDRTAPNSLFDKSAIQQQPTIHTFWFSSTSGKKYWMNGGKSADASSTTQTTSLISNPDSAIGSYVTTAYNYNGDIAEFIVFNRDLTTEERQAIESYLSQKYSIKISG